MRRWGVLLGLFGAAAAFSQPIDADQKAEVLNKVKDILTETAFVPGVSFDKWTGFLESRQDDLNAAEDKRRFVSILNRTLREFGVSHISIGFSKKKTDSAGGQALLQDPATQIQPQELEWLDDKTVRLRLRSFGETYDRKAIEKAFGDAARAETLILDLRGNGGGAVSNLQHFLSLLLPPKTEVGTMVSRRIAKAYADATKGDATNGLEIAKWTDRKFRTGELKLAPFKGKVAVLVSRGSASASEICTAALKEVLNAPIVGGKTAGAVLVSRIIPLPDDLEIKVPMADYYTAKYRRLEGNPLVPDAEENVRDTAACVKRALELIQKS
jgi:hypothetical protein